MIRPDMTWVKSQQRWTKHYKESTYSVSPKQLGCPATKEGSLLAANAWWARKQQEIDAQEKASQPQPWHPRQDIILAAMRENLGLVDPDIVRIVFFKMLEKDDLPLWLREALLGQERQAALDDGVATLVGAPTPSHRTMAAQVEEWLGLLRLSVRQGLQSSGRVEAYIRHINLFARWVGESQPVDVLTASKLEAFWAYLSTQISEQKYSPAYCQTILMTAKQFIRRLEEIGMIPLPGNIQSRRLVFRIAPREADRLPLETVRLLLETAPKYSERTYLYLLLMLNCGMYQNDVAELATDEVSWTAGTLTRKRSKNRKRKDSPTVTYKLWPETFALLTKYRAGKTVLNEYGKPRALLSDRGEALVRYWQEEVNGKLKERRKDCVGEALVRLYEEAGLQRQGVKCLRKTSASELGSHPVYRSYVQHFLANSPKGIVDRDDLQPDQASFFAALDWLRARYFGDDEV